MTNEKKKTNADASTRELSQAKLIDAITHYITHLNSIRRCASEYIKQAELVSQEWAKSNLTVSEFKEPESEGDLPHIELTYSGGEIDDVYYHLLSPHAEILSQGLLIFGFSTFDAFVSSFLQSLYQSETSLVYKIENKKIDVGDFIQCDSIQDALSRAIERDISSLLRGSYDDLFSTLANRHGIETLKKFQNWTHFIEASQRRNLITHCGGVVNEQYIRCCKAAGVAIPSETGIGKKLRVSPEYLADSLDILYEVGVKLAITIWRKSSPDNLQITEKFLTDELFNLLTKEDWKNAKILGEFALTIPGKKNDMQSKISRLNYAQALKWSGLESQAIKVLDEIDWSGSIRDFRLGQEVLRGNFEKAAKLMKEIGKEGELLIKSGYEKWPIFREFRGTAEFKKAYHEIYGIEFQPPRPPEASSGREVNEKSAIRGAASVILALTGRNPPNTLKESTVPSEKPIVTESSDNSETVA